MADLSKQFDQINIDPSHRTMVRRLRNIYEATPDEIREAGHHWYGNVHDAAQKAARENGRTTRQAAGVVAAVSPNMDWERNNIHAFHEINQLTPEHWDAIQRSNNQPRVVKADGTTTKARRTDEVKEILRGMSISTSPDSNLLKAHRIWNGGEDPENVLVRQTAPKTNTFFRNINGPHEDNGGTVDGRHADLIVDAMRPWSGGRGIQSASLPTGRETRYDRYSNATSAASRHYNILPHQFQAVDWEMGKLLERNNDPSRSQGDARTGQSYSGRLKEFMRDH